MAILSKIKSHSNAIDYLKNLPIYKKSIKKPKVKRWKNNDQLAFLWADQAFRGYAMSYKAEMIERKVPIVQLQASKSSIKDFFSYLLDETKVFKYQITVKLLLKNTSSMER